MEDYGEMDLAQLKELMNEQSISVIRRVQVELFHRLENTQSELDRLRDLIEETASGETGGLSNALERLRNPPLKIYPISGVSDELTNEIHELFHVAIGRKLETMESRNMGMDHPLFSFYKTIEERVDKDEYRGMQEKFLSLNGVRRWGNRLKFMHPTRFFDSRYNLARRIGLEDGNQYRILEIGCCAGQFSAIANHLGHSAIGLEVDSELYREMCGLWDVELLVGEIDEDGELPDLGDSLGDGFDLITAFAASFNRKDGLGWENDIWARFIANVKKEWLNEGGRMIIQLSRKNTSDETWDYLSDLASEFDSDKLELTLVN